ncbi:MAG: hypothetical protein H6706_10870 [Myxococcales bacterium]|nr:hypothetical protein [Myxococcales bacterium]
MKTLAWITFAALLPACVPELTLKECYGEACADMAAAADMADRGPEPDGGAVDAAPADVGVDARRPPPDTAPPDPSRCTTEMLDSNVVFTAYRGARGQTFRATGTVIDRIAIGVSDGNVDRGAYGFTISLFAGVGYVGEPLAEETIMLRDGFSNLAQVDIDDVRVQPGGMYTLRIVPVAGRGFVLAVRHDGIADPYPDGDHTTYGGETDERYDTMFQVLYSACSDVVTGPQPDPCTLEQTRGQVGLDLGTLGQTFVATGPTVAGMGVEVFDDDTRPGEVRYTLSLHPGVGFDGEPLFTGTQAFRNGFRSLAWFEPDTPVPVEVGQVYTLRARREEPRSVMVALRHDGIADPYPDGHLVDEVGRLNTDYDLQFRVVFGRCD